MSNVNIPITEIEEVTSILTPAPGVTVEQALEDAQITGYDRLEILDGAAVITWFKKKGSDA